MTFYLHEGRLIAINADASKGLAWDAKAKIWRAIAGGFAGTVWIEGKKLSEDEAKHLFPGADLAAAK